MTPYHAYKLYSAIKLHFETETYDYFKYRGKMRCTSESKFSSRKDFPFYYKLARIEDLENYLVANFLEANSGFWVGELFTLEAKDNYIDWQRRMESFTYNLKREYNYYRFRSEFDDNYPKIINLLQRKEISLETALIIEEKEHFIEEMQKNFGWDPIWQQLRLKLVKYKPWFVKALEQYTGYKYSMKVTTA